MFFIFVIIIIIFFLQIPLVSWCMQTLACVVSFYSSLGSSFLKIDGNKVPLAGGGECGTERGPSIEGSFGHGDDVLWLLNW